MAALCIYMHGRQAGPYVAKVIKVRLLLRCTVWVPGWAALPGSSACAVCRTQCIFNEVQLPSVLHTIPLKGATSRPLPDLCFSSWIWAEELWTINNWHISKKLYIQSSGCRTVSLLEEGPLWHHRRQIFTSLCSATAKEERANEVQDHFFSFLESSLAN